MRPVRKAAVWLFTIVVLVDVWAVLCLSKPDLGGVKACAKIFAMPNLGDFGLIHQPFVTWDPFESRKFRFAISFSDFVRLQEELRRLGYSEWQRGGVTFGSVSVGGAGNDDYAYCKLEKGGRSYYWSYSEDQSLIYAITFP